MRAFAELYAALDETNKTNAKLALLQDYLMTLLQKVTTVKSRAECALLVQ